MGTEMVQQPHDDIPDHIRQYQGQKARIGNVDATDLVIPRVMLIQALSPELTEFDAAKPGQFWHSVAHQNMGTELLAIPIVTRKTYILWAPRGDDRGILARAMDGKHWDQPHTEFTVNPPGNPGSVTYKLGKTVHDNGLDLFGSSIPGNPRSKPAASKTWTTLWYFPEFPELSPSVIINTRSSVKPMETLLTRIDSKTVPHYAQMYTIGVKQDKGPLGPYFNYTYAGAGYPDAETCKITEGLFHRFDTAEWKPADESVDVDEDEKPQRQYNENTAQKF